MEMVRVLRPPKGDAVCRQNRGGAHRHQSETHLCCMLTLAWCCDQVLFLPTSILFTHLTHPPPPSLFPTIQVDPALCHTLFRISNTSGCRSGERLLLSRYLGNVHSFHHLISTQVQANTQIQIYSLSKHTKSYFKF